MNGYAPPGGAGRQQSRGEEVANAASHGAALAAALVAGYWLVAWGRSRSAEGFAGVCVFVATMVWLYLASTVYHALPQGRAKRIFLKLDHGAVYLFIAGSYTVFASGHLGGPGAGAMLVVVLAWVYYAAQIFLLGAEFTKVYADERGSAVGKRAVAATQTGALVAAAGSDITADMLPATPAGTASPAAHSDVLQAQVQILEQRTGQQRAQLWALAGLVLAQQVRWHWHRRKTRRAPRP